MSVVMPRKTGAPRGTGKPGRGCSPSSAPVP